MVGIKDRRVRAKLSQAKLANLADVSLSTVRRWDLQSDNITASKLLVLADIFDCKVEDLLQGDV